MLQQAEYAVSWVCLIWGWVVITLMILGMAARSWPWLQRWAFSTHQSASVVTLVVVVVSGVLLGRHIGTWFGAMVNELLGAWHPGGPTPIVLVLVPAFGLSLLDFLWALRTGTLIGKWLI